jgi:hypothetical protein
MKEQARRAINVSRDVGCAHHLRRLPVKSFCNNSRSALLEAAMFDARRMQGELPMPFIRELAVTVLAAALAVVAPAVASAQSGLEAAKNFSGSKVDFGPASSSPAPNLSGNGIDTGGSSNPAGNALQAEIQRKAAERAKAARAAAQNAALKRAQEAQRKAIELAQKQAKAAQQKAVAEKRAAAAQKQAQDAARKAAEMTRQQARAARQAAGH